jgi:hypothetical protein
MVPGTMWSLPEFALPAAGERIAADATPKDFLKFLGTISWRV